MLQMKKLSKRIRKFVNRTLEDVRDSDAVEGVVCLANKVIRALENAWNASVQFFANLLDTLVCTAVKVWKNIVAFLQMLLRIIVQTAETVFTCTLEFASGVYKKGARTTESAWGSTMEFMESSLEMANDMLKAVGRFRNLVAA